MKKTAVCWAALVVAILIPVLVTLLATESVAFSERFYLQQYEILGLKESTGFSASEYRQFGQALQDYYRNRRVSPQVFIATDQGPQPLYQDHELAHLADVYHLFRLGVTLRNIAATLIAASIGLIILLEKKHWHRSLLIALTVGSIGGIVLFLLLLLAVRINFNQAFTYFHLLSFNNILWQLDPAKDNLIRLFPEQFFLNATLIIAGRALIMLTILAAIGILRHFLSSKTLSLLQ
ncbi:MAG: TIGR01906 family membrane protein [Firmicutes bacterium]|nr:TIGR01906 family membrane protein [Bacillota bacterium]